MNQWIVWDFVTSSFCVVCVSWVSWVWCILVLWSGCNLALVMVLIVQRATPAHQGWTVPACHVLKILWFSYSWCLSWCLSVLATGVQEMVLWCNWCWGMIFLSVMEMWWCGRLWWIETWWGWNGLRVLGMVQWPVKWLWSWHSVE